MKRGDVVLVALPGDFGKPRPAIVIQSDRFVRDHATILVCPLTSDLTDSFLFRPQVSPTPANGLRAVSQIMVDKIHPIWREKVRGPIGELDETTTEAMNDGIALFTGLED